MENNDQSLSPFPLPREIIAHILSFLDARTLVFSCRRVCRNLKDLVDNDVCKLKVREINSQCIPKLYHAEQHRPPGIVFYKFLDAKPIVGNLLQNNCGKRGMTHWIGQALSGFVIENPPIGADPLPQSEDFQGCTGCFATTYYPCEKLQRVDLRRQGISEELMDELQPTIVASEWYAGRYDCGCTYRLTVSLLDSKKSVIDEKYVEKQVEQWKGREWHKVAITFDNYGPGVHFISFTHRGEDTQYWAGHYGSKMSGGVVRLCIPKPVSNSK